MVREGVDVGRKGGKELKLILGGPFARSLEISQRALIRFFFFGSRAQAQRRAYFDNDFLRKSSSEVTKATRNRQRHYLAISSPPPSDLTFVPSSRLTPIFPFP